MTDDKLRAALTALLAQIDHGYGQRGNPVFDAAVEEARAALAASAPDEGPDYGVLEPSDYPERQLRPAVPALDVERLARVFRGDVMADWLGIVVGITDPKHPPLAEGFARDFAVSVAREYAALSEKQP